MDDVGYWVVIYALIMYCDVYEAENGHEFRVSRS